MKKVLFISDQYIFGVIGGSLGHKKFYDILSNDFECEFKIISLDGDLNNRLNVILNKNKFIDIYTRIKLHSSFLFFYTEKICKAVYDFNPQIIIIGRSRLGFLAKRLRELLPSSIIITNFDNIEFDYVEAQFAQKTGLIGNVIKKWEKYAVKRDEYNCINYSDKFVFLSKRDQERAEKIYGVINEDNSYIFPICLKETVDINKKTENKNLIFIGNLEYAANIKSIIWFIENVWIPYYSNAKDIILNIAGKSANSVLNKYKDIENIKIYSDFKNVSDIVYKNSLYIAPIQTGAGMKVKIAEALSMGLPIIGTDEALVGYEDAEEYLAKEEGFFIRANSVKDYQKYIEEYKNMQKEKLEEISRNNKKVFNLFYSYNQAKNILQKIIF